MENNDKQEILEAIHAFAEQVDKRFEQVDKRFEQVDKRFEQVDKRFEQVDKHLERMDGRIGAVESQMVTKDYLDEKMADLRGDMVVLTRKEDHKVVALVDELVQQGVLTAEAGKRILRMEPFPMA